MFRRTENTEAVKAKMQTSIGVATGLNNISKSSVLTHILDAVSGVASDTSKFVAQTINSTFTEFAEGDILTDNGYEFGVLRNIYSDIYIRSDDAILAVATSDGSYFPKYSSGKKVIDAGQRYTFGQAVIEILEDVYLDHTSTEIFVSARIVADSATDIKTSSYIEIMKPGDINTSGIRLVFKQPVYTRLFEETDESFRSRVMDAKIKIHGSSLSAISGIVKHTPYVSAHYIEEDNASGLIKVYVATDKTLKGEDDLTIMEIRSRIQQRLDYIASAEQAIQILKPEILKAYPVYTYKGVTEAMALAAIKESFDAVYVPFSTSISIDAINEELKKYELEIELGTFGLKSDSYGTFDVQDSGTFIIPNGYIVVFSAADSLGTKV